MRGVEVDENDSAIRCQNEAGKTVDAEKLHCVGEQRHDGWAAVSDPAGCTLDVRRKPKLEEDATRETACAASARSSRAGHADPGREKLKDAKRGRL